MELCALCKKNETGRLIKGVPVCGRCFIAGQYNLPENQAKLAEGDLTDPTVSEPPAPKQKPEVIPNGMFWCFKCNVLHRIDKKIGQRHLKYQTEPKPEPELDTSKVEGEGNGDNTGQEEEEVKTKEQEG